MVTVSVAEWSKALDSSSNGSVRVGSNPTADIFEPFFDLLECVEIHSKSATDSVAEWLRRRPAKPMCSARVGSNPIAVDILKNENLPRDNKSATYRDRTCDLEVNSLTL